MEINTVAQAIRFLERLGYRVVETHGGLWDAWITAPGRCVWHAFEKAEELVPFAREAFFHIEYLKGGNG